MSEFVSLYWKLENPYYHTAQCSPWATGQAGGGWRWGIQLRITINFHNSWLSHVTRWNFDEKCNFFFTLQLRNLLFFYFALDFVFYSCPEQRFTTLHSNWDLLVQLGFNQSHHDDVVRYGGKSENSEEASSLFVSSVGLNFLCLTNQIRICRLYYPVKYPSNAGAA